MAPPGLAWLNSFSISTGAALDQGIVAEVYSTVNPLVYTVRVRWPESISMKNAVMVWNLLQKWAAANKTTPDGRVDFVQEIITTTREVRIRGFSVDIHIRERLGHPKNEYPK
jgi:hypothetical protein